MRKVEFNAHSQKVTVDELARMFKREIDKLEARSDKIKDELTLLSIRIKRVEQHVGIEL